MTRNIRKVVAAGYDIALLALALPIALIGAAQGQTAEEQKRQAASGLIAANYGVELDPISVYADRNARQVLSLPQNVTVIGRQELDERMVRDVQDLVRYVEQSDPHLVEGLLAALLQDGMTMTALAASVAAITIKRLSGRRGWSPESSIEK